LDRWSTAEWVGGGEGMDGGVVVVGEAVGGEDGYDFVGSRWEEIAVDF